MRTVRLTRQDTGTDLAVNPENIVAVVPASEKGKPLVGISGLMLPGGVIVPVGGSPAAIAAQLGPDFVQLSESGSYCNRRMVLLVEAGRDKEERTILGVVVAILLGAPKPLVVSGSVGEVAQALELGGGKQDQRSRLVLQ